MTIMGWVFVSVVNSVKSEDVSHEASLSADFANYYQIAPSWSLVMDSLCVSKTPGQRF